jgi:hypothetical protein
MHALVPAHRGGRAQAERTPVVWTLAFVCDRDE